MSVGCKSEEKKELGRYVEEQYDFPVNAVTSMAKLDNGDIISVSLGDYGNIVKLISNDCGKTWESQSIELPIVGDLVPEAVDVVVGSNGDIVVSYAEGEANAESELKYAKIDSSGELIDIDINIATEDEPKLRVSGIYIADNGDIFYSYMSTVVQLDGETLEEKNRYEAEDYVLNYTLIGEELIIQGQEDVVSYDITSGNKKGKLETLNNEIIDNKDNDYKRILDSNSKDKIYYSSSQGLFEYDLKADKTKQIVDGSLSNFDNLGNSGMAVNLIEKEDGDFLVLFDEYKNFELNGVLINYHFDKALSTVPDKQIVVYSVKEDEIIKNAIESYAKKHRDIYIKYETGVTKENCLTESDAINILNRKIMMGKGPDVILLDGLNVDKYIEKGSLEDISDIVNSNDELFTNVAKAFTVDGKIYQCPLNLAIPMIAGNKDKVEKVNDLDSLLAVTKELKDENEDKIVPYMESAKELFYQLSYLYGDDWITADKKINKDSLNNYMNKVKEIHTIIDERAKDVEDQKATDDENLIDNLTYDQKETLNMEWGLTTRLMTYGLYGDEKSSIAYGAFSNSLDLMELLSLMDSNEDASYKVMNSAGKKIFIPIACLGINAKSKNKDTAKDFIKELLTEESQNEITSSGLIGLPVNKKAFADNFEALKEKGELDEETNNYVIINDDDKTIIPNEDDVNNFISQIEELDGSAKLNKKLLLKAGKKFNSFQEGEKTIDDAVKEGKKYINCAIKKVEKYINYAIKKVEKKIKVYLFE